MPPEVPSPTPSSAPTPPTPPERTDTESSTEPKKYIRTYAADMETLQKGGTPDLTPLKNQTPLERIVAASPVPEKPVAPPAPPVEPPKPPAPPPGPTPIQTYSSDFSDQVKKTNASPATVLAAEQDAAPAPSPVSQATPPPRWKNIVFTAGGIILIILGAIGAYAAYLQYKTNNAPVPITTPQISAPIFVDEQEEIFGSGTDLMIAMNASVAKPLAVNTVRHLYASSTQSVFAMLSLNAPNVIVRNVRKEGSMAGVVNANGVQSPFFILSVSSYGDTFAGMLAWEETMVPSLSPIFAASVGVPTPEVTTASTTPVMATTTATSTPPKTKVATTTKSKTATTTAAVLQQAGFKDEVISNHDARVYRNEKGEALIVYGYWNQTTLVIAKDPAAFMELLSRLATTRTL